MFKYFALMATMLVCLSGVTSRNTPLENFVYRPDQGWSYSINSTFTGPGYTAYVLNLTSINWLESPLTDHPRWWHWVTICVPNFVTYNTGFLYVDNGNYETAAPTTLYPLIDQLCRTSRSVVSYLNQLPNQALMLEGVSRSEDAILGWTWRKFLENSTNYDILGQFPETKAVVRTFDAIQKFVKDNLIFVPRVKNFVVSGASKRGWASWLTAAVDSRVKAVVPVVMPILNMEQNCESHYRSYGGWSFAYYNYYSEGVMAYLGTPGFYKLSKEIDPINWVDQLLMPKYIVTAVGDQFFIPDSSRYFFDKLLGNKHQRIHPNTDHSFASRMAQFVQEVNTYYNLILNRQSLPEFEWSVIPDLSTNTTTINVLINKRDPPSAVLVYTADTISTTKRDWRMTTCASMACYQNITWVPTTLTQVPNSDGLYRTTISAPTAGGWRGAFVELTYDSIFGDHKYTTEFFYAPYTFPFDACTGLQCQSTPFPQ